MRAKDLGYNLSRPSDAVTATTAASTDTTPPTAPTNLLRAVDSAGNVSASSSPFTLVLDDCL